jgi:Transglycosylase SLT domain
MRSIIACGFILLGLNGTAHEPEYAARFSEYFATASDRSVSTLVEIDSSTGRSDRLDVASLQPRVLALQIFRPTDADLQLRLASASADLDAGTLAAVSAGANDIRGTDVSLDDLCQALFTSAQANDIPVQFFANLIWQESRLNPDDVSKKGAMGIAQFMPQVAAEKGLDDPFDPMQAIPASARLLRELRTEFGNLGLVAAAYNAGPGRVARWLERRVDLPRETRNYVVRVTGLSVDAWRTMRVSNDALTFVQHLPCRSMPAFANVEQEQAVQTEAKIEQAKLEEPDVTGAVDDMPALPPDTKAAHDFGGKSQGKSEGKSAGKSARTRGKHEGRRGADKATAGRPAGKHEAAKQEAGKQPAAKRENGKHEVDRRPHTADKRRV